MGANMISPMFGVVRTIALLLRDAALMGLYVTFLLPGFLQMAWFYVTTKNRLSIRYKPDSCRNTLDVYPPMPQQQHNNTSIPVVLMFPGGAFMIGYKMWASLLAQAMTGRVLVIAADYRNYPFGTVPDMVEDVADAIQWTLQHCADFGGDPSKVVAIGQSAGAHLVMTALLRQQQQQQSDSSWKPTDLAGAILLSGVYDVSKLVISLAQHGVSREFVEQQLFGGQAQTVDPVVLLSQQQRSSSQIIMPPIEVWHGTADKTVDCGIAKAFATQLSASNDVKFMAYPNWSHTDPIIEAVLEGNHSFHYDVARKVEEWCNVVELGFEPPAHYPWCPRFLVQLSRKVSPF